MSNILVGEEVYRIGLLDSPKNSSKLIVGETYKINKVTSNGSITVCKDSFEYNGEFSKNAFLKEEFDNIPLASHESVSTGASNILGINLYFWKNIYHFKLFNNDNKFGNCVPYKIINNYSSDDTCMPIKIVRKPNYTGPYPVVELKMVPFGEGARLVNKILLGNKIIYEQGKGILDNITSIWSVVNFIY